MHLKKSCFLQLLREGLGSHRPVQHVLQDVDGHDDARLPAAVEGEDGEVGRQHVGGLLGVCSRSCTAAAGDGQGGGAEGQRGHEKQ